VAGKTNRKNWPRLSRGMCYKQRYGAQRPENNHRQIRTPCLIKSDSRETPCGYLSERFTKNSNGTRFSIGWGWQWKNTSSGKMPRTTGSLPMCDRTSFDWLKIVLLSLGIGLVLTAVSFGQCIGGQCRVPGNQVIRPVVPSPRRPAVHSPAHPSVVRIAVEERDGMSYGSGTLIAVNEKCGLVLTNWHVIRDGCGRIAVAFPGGFRSAATVLKTDEDWDLAALMIWKPPVAVKPVTIGRRRPIIGAILRVAGFGHGVFRIVTGRVIQFLSPGRNLPYEIIEVGVAARDGDSGGPIFDEQGRLAGVLFGTANGRTAGSDCERVRIFLGGILRPIQTRPTAVEKPTTIVEKPVELPTVPTVPAVDQCVELRAEIAALRAQLLQLAGEDGQNGKIDIQELTAVVLQRLQPRLDKPITIQILDDKGNVRQQTQAGLGGTLQFQLVPVKK